MGRPGSNKRGGGFGGGGGGMGGMGGMGGGAGGFDPMKMLEGATQGAKKAAEELEKELATKMCEGAAGGGMVTATVTGTLDLRSIKIDPSVIDKAEKDMLEDLVVAAVNAATKKAKELQAAAQADLQQKQIQQMFGGGGMGDIGKMLGM